MSKTTKIQSECPYCYESMTRATDPLFNQEPKVGDIAVCSDCKRISIFDGNMVLVIPQEEEMNEIEGNPEIMADVEIARRLRPPRDKDTR